MSAIARSDIVLFAGTGTAAYVDALDDDYARILQAGNEPRIVHVDELVPAPRRLAPEDSIEALAVMKRRETESLLASRELLEARQLRLRFARRGA